MSLYVCVFPFYSFFEMDCGFQRGIFSVVCQLYLLCVILGNIGHHIL